MLNYSIIYKNNIKYLITRVNSYYQNYALLARFKLSTNSILIEFLKEIDNLIPSLKAIWYNIDTLIRLLTTKDRYTIQVGEVKLQLYLILTSLEILKFENSRVLIKYLYRLPATWDMEYNVIFNIVQVIFIGYSNCLNKLERESNAGLKELLKLDLKEKETESYKSKSVVNTK